MMRALALLLLASATVTLAGVRPAAAADSQTEETTVDGRMHNPTLLSELSGQSWTFVRDAFHNQKLDCFGYITREPVAVLKPQGVQDLVLHAPGAGLLVVQLDDRKVLTDCPNERDDANGAHVPSIHLKDLGLVAQVTVWAGMPNQGVRFPYALRMEDPKRPLVLDIPPKTPRFKLADDPKKAIVQTVNVAKGAGAKGYGAGCGESLFRAAPDVVLDVGRALTDVTIEVRSPKPVKLMLLGPYPKDFRVVEKCAKDKAQVLPRLEPGMYVIKIGTSGVPTTASVVVRGKKTQRDPLALAPLVPEQLPLAERNVFFHFPQLLGPDVRELDEVRQGLFDVAPPQLFVYPQSDLVSLRTIFDPRMVSGVDPVELPEGAKIEYPRRNEPLLLIGANQALSSDGNMYEVQLGDLVEEPRAGVVAVPERARNGRLTFESAPMHASAAAAEGGGHGVSSEFGAASKEYRACADKIWGPVDKKVKALRAQPYSLKREEQIRVTSEQARQQEDKMCGGNEQKKKALREEFIKGRIAKRNTALAKIRRRFAELWPEAEGQ